MRAEVQAEPQPDGHIRLHPRPRDPGQECSSRSLDQVLRDWSLVLWAMHIPHHLVQDREGPALLLPEAQAEAAREQIALFESENREQPACPQPQAEQGSMESVFWVLLVLALWHGICQRQIQTFGFDPVPWLELGRVDARAMLDQGQWWRAWTALTLHSGPEHLISNLVFGGLFMRLLGQELGGGLAWLLTVLAAGLANGVNVLIQGPPHLAIGASTAVFAALGQLSGVRMHTETAWSRVLLPLGAGLALLAWLGSGGQNTDLGAHGFGFGVGLGLGLAVRWGLNATGISVRDVPHTLFGLGAWTIMLAAWGMALIH